MDKIFNHYTIRVKSKEIGYIHMCYYDSLQIPAIEYEINKEYRNKGIMTKAVMKYIECLKKEGLKYLCAVVEKNNEASKKVLKKNNFYLLSKTQNYCHFVCCLDKETMHVKNILKYFKKYKSHN